MPANNTPKNISLSTPACIDYHRFASYHSTEGIAVIDVKKHSIIIIIAGCMWGLMGLFRRNLGELGFSSVGAVIVRCGIAALFYLATILITDPKNLKFKLKDIWCFICTGVISLLFLSICYFQAMLYMSLSAAAILLYTAPALVMLLSVIFFGEKFTAVKAVALFLSLLGCALVSGLGSGSLNFTFIGLLYGIGSGVGYALYSIFLRVAINKGYSNGTINFYSCLFAAIGAGLIEGFREPVKIIFSSWNNCLFCILASVVTCYLPYMMYAYGLTGTENGKASIMASVEPVVATLVGFLIYHESMSALSAAGVFLVIAAVVLLNIKIGRRQPESSV